MCRCPTNRRSALFDYPRPLAFTQRSVPARWIKGVSKENRTKKIDARFTEAEYQLVLALEKELGVRKTDLVRMRLLGDAPAVVLNAKELIRSLDSIGAELGHSGNNINQLARYANILNKKRMLSPVVMERFNILFEQYISHQKNLEAALRSIVRAMNH
jgi:hypothetical protein